MKKLSGFNSRVDDNGFKILEDLDSFIEIIRLK